MSALSLVTVASEYPITLDEAKRHLVVDHDDDDDLIEEYIAAATDEAERFLGRALIDQAWDYFLDEFEDEIELPKSPLIEVVGVFYKDAAGDEQEFEAFSVDLSSGKIYLPTGGSWPTASSVPSAVRIRFRSGYLDTGVSPPVANVPAAIKHAIKIGVGDFYQSREPVVIGQSVSHLPTWERLLRRYRVALGMA